jgi:hypothetical protein
MATDPFELYPVIAQIAAAFAGFGSLASGIGQRRGGHDARIDAWRLSFMLFVCLAATLLGLLPATLSGLSLGPEWGVRASAFTGVITLLVYTPLSTSRIRRLRHVGGFSKIAAVANIGFATAALVAFALCALAIPAGRGPDLYLVGLMGLLGSSMVMFSRVITSMLRPYSEADGSDH